MREQKPRPARRLGTGDQAGDVPDDGLARGRLISRTPSRLCGDVPARKSIISPAVSAELLLSNRGRRSVSRAAVRMTRTYIPSSVKVVAKQIA
jgi:hypothetical protein